MVREEANRKSEGHNLQTKLDLKDKEIEEIVERYEANIEQLKKQHGTKVNNKLEQFNIVKGQKDQLIRDLSDSLKAKVQENQSLLLGINKLKQVEGTLKIQKEKIEGKFTELCKNNKDLLSKN